MRPHDLLLRVNGPSFISTESGMPILPISCIGAATSSTCTVSAQAQMLADQRGVLGHANQMIAGGLVAEFAGFGELQRFQLALVDLGDGLVDLVLQHACLIGKHDLVAAQLEQIGAARARLVLVERLDQEIGGARFESGIADLRSSTTVITTIGTSTQWGSARSCLTSSMPSNSGSL